MAQRLPGEWAFELVEMTVQQRTEAASNDGIAISDLEGFVAWMLSIPRTGPLALLRFGPPLYSALFSSFV